MRSKQYRSKEDPNVVVEAIVNCAGWAGWTKVYEGENVHRMPNEKFHSLFEPVEAGNDSAPHG